MRTLHVAVVIPCLNEEVTLTSTAHSLGFGNGGAPANTHLVLVDNGSKDHTLQVARSIQATSPDGSVIVSQEPEQGYVPPRHCGTLLMRRFAKLRGLSESDILIIQADADTEYSDGYTDELRKCSITEGLNVIVEGCSKYPSKFLKAHSKYVKLCDEVDNEFERLLSDHPDDVIVDDKTCGYRLSDYFLWGGHRQEFNARGDEIHSETTRLYIRAKGGKCRRVRVDNAVARHSTRREEECPSLAFATAGFPREASWKRSWKRLYKGTDSIADFPDKAKNIGIEVAIDYRRKHMLSLFLALPLHISRALGTSSKLKLHPDAGKVLSQLPRRSKRWCITGPGGMIEDALRIFGIDS